MKLGSVDFCPEDDLKVFLGFEKWKNFHAEWAEQDVCMADAADREPQRERGKGQRDEGEPAELFEIWVIRSPL